MKRTSRFLALLLSAVMLLALAGCGGKDMKTLEDYAYLLDPANG